MPHLTVEFSANLKNQVEIFKLVETVHQAAQVRLIIPMRPGFRSLNVAMAAALAVGEALRQTGGFPASAAQGPAS